MSAIRASFSIFIGNENSRRHQPTKSTPGASSHFLGLERIRARDESTRPQVLIDNPAKSLVVRPAKLINSRNEEVNSGNTSPNPCALSRSRRFEKRILWSSTIAQFA